MAGKDKNNGNGNGNGGGNNNATSKNIYGTENDDVLVGNDANNKIYGDLGNDLLQGLEGNDHLFGEAGNDTLEGGTGNDKLDGGAGDDILEGGEGNDNLLGGEGDDEIIWNAGDRNDEVDGGEGEDTFTLNTSDAQQQTVHLDVNEDGQLVATVDGDEGGEISLVDIENFNLQVGLGGANLVIGDVPDDLFGGEPVGVGGGDGDDVIDTGGSTQAVSVSAGAGNDTVTTGSGNDVISGGAGDDTINAGVGNDTVVWKAGDGNDTVDGGDGDDQVDLNLDDENVIEPTTLSVQKDASGNVVLVSSDGSTLTLSQVEEVVITAARSGTSITIGDLTGTHISQNTLYFNGGIGADTLDASATDRRIVATGNGGNDVLRSGSGNDTLDGGAGHDILDAGSGSGVDTVLGGSGDDQITVTLGDEQGSDAIDIIDGGADNDTLDVIFTEPTPHDMILNVFSNGDGTFTLTSSDIDIDEEVRVSNVENLLITADEPGLNFILGTLSDTSLVQGSVDFHGSSGADSFDGSGTDVSLNLFGNDGDDNLIGGSQGDHFEGGEGNDSLDGEGGDDWLIGGAGNDIMDGGADWDTADYSGAAGGVTVDLSNALAQDTGSAGVDTLVNIEQVAGSAFADNLTAGNQDSTLHGNDGNDDLVGGAGFDLLYGGNGDDTLTDNDGQFVGGLLSGDAGADHLDGTATYMNDGAGVKVNLSDAQEDMGGDLVNARSAIDGYGDTDTFGANAQNLWASQFNDHVIGSDAGQLIVTRAGNDIVDAGAGDDSIRSGSGDDAYDGGDGIDTLQLFADPFDAAGGPVQGSVVDLSANSMTDGWGNSDTINNIENVFGSSFGDTITGDDNDNVLLGLGGDDMVSGGGGNDFVAAADGNDTLDGGAGNDTIVGASGDDTLTGGSGADTYQLITEVQDAYNFGHDTITDFDVAEDVIDLTPFEQYGAISQLDIAEAGGNTTITIDSDRSITLNGVSAGSLVAANFIFSGEPPPPPATVGTEGDDVLVGTSGNDSLSGLGGNDRLEGLEGDDILDGGDGRDFVIYNNDPAGIDANFLTGTVIDGFGDTDTLIDIESILGSEFNDHIIGDAGDNFISSRGGDDIIDAGAGDDSILSGEGNDQVDGGAGFDHVSLFLDTLFQGFPRPGMSIVYNGDGTITATNKVTGEVDSYSNIEALTTSLGDDDVTGDGGDSFIGLRNGSAKTVDGGAGTDTLVSVITNNGTLVDMVAGTVQMYNTDGTLNTTQHSISNFENVMGSQGNDTIIGDAGDNILEGQNGADNLTGGAGNDTLNGGLSVLWPNPFLVDDEEPDTANYLNDPGAISANLVTGLVQDGYGGQDTLVSIENIQGSNFDDTITGDANSNLFFGNGGIDTISGGDGDDFIFGGTGIDILDGGAGSDRVYFSGDGIGFLQPGLTITFSNVDDTITSSNPNGDIEVVNNFEQAFGTLGHDQITGDDQDNLIGGFLGSDILDGGAGNDTLWSVIEGTTDLSAGTIVYANSNLGIATLANFENVVGSAGEDLLIGDSGDNEITGGDNNDVLIGNAGNDLLNGGRHEALNIGNDDDPGVDTVDYSADPGAVSVNLAAGTATDGFGGSDTLQNIDNVIGSAFNDTLIGDDNANVLEGLGGDDTLTGGDGADVFRPNDDVNGDAAFGHDTITDFNPAEDVINLRDFPTIRQFGDIQLMLSDDGGDALVTFDAGNSIRLTGVDVNALTADNFDFIEDQYIEGTPNNDTLEGAEGDDTILGFDGDDQLRGFDGNDTIDGGAGFDNIWGGDGDDILEGGSEWDNVYGEGGNDIITDNAGGGYLEGGDGDDIISAFNSNANMDGGDGNDTLTGSSNQWNELRGGDGDDVLIDPDGSGILFGGSGNDSLDGQVNYLEDPAGIYANLAGTHGDGNSWAINGEVVDSRTAIDGWGDIDILEAGVTGNFFTATNFDDYIQAAEFATQSFELAGGNDTLIAGVGTVYVNAGSGADYLDGGDDWDGVQFWDNQNDSAGPQTQGVIVNVSGQDFEYEPGMTALANRVIDPWGFTDEVYNFESVNGSQQDDVLIGGDEHNWLEGDEGNDRLFGGDVSGDNLVGGPGDDYIDGQGGDWDTAWYNRWLYEEVDDGSGFIFFQQVESGPGINANLNTGVVLDHHGGTDTLVSIENIEGSPYDDLITGDGNNNHLVGAQGDDVIYGGAGEDGLQGREGNDELYGEDGNDWLQGHEGDDLIDGGAGQDEVNYDAGSGTTSGLYIDMTNIVDAGGYTSVVVTPDGTGGTDYLRGIENIWGTDHDDTVIGDAADNNFHGNVGNDNLVGGAGNDRLDGGDDFDTLDGGAGNDDLFGGENGDTLTGGSEGDVFHFSRFTNFGNLTSFGEDTITDFNPLEDTLDFNQVPEFTSLEAVQSLVTSLPGEELVISFVTSDFGVPETNSITFVGLTDADLPNMNIWFAPLAGTDGDDTLDGGSAGEFIQAYGGNDTVNGNDGNDSIEGGAGDDVLNGGNGQDHFIGGSGNDIIDGGDGWDNLSFWNSAETLNNHFGPNHGVTIDLSLGSNQVQDDGFGNSDTLVNIEHISGTNYADNIAGHSADDNFNGNNGDDILSGGDGNDSLHGDQGNDTISGGTGNDWISGGAGNDNLSGGADSVQDHFNFNAWDDFGNPADFGHDIISDFDVGYDRLDFYSAGVSNGDISFSDDAGDLLLSIDANNSVRLQGLAGVDPATINIGYAPIFGTEGADIFNGDASDENYEGRGGNDVINGNDGNDNLHGGSGDDTISGGNGFDNISGGSGADILDGGADWDNVDYNSQDNDAGAILPFQGIIMNLSDSDVVYDGGQPAAAAERVIDSTGFTDEIYNIESVFATQWNDVLIGDNRAHSYLNGGDGDDLIIGRGDGDNFHGGQGNDTLDGSEGINDNANYNTGQEFTGVNVNLDTGIATDGQGGTDTLIGIEGVNGSVFDDVLVGNASPNFITGAQGNDSLEGGDGNDNLHGDDGNDVLDAGLGNDWLSGGAGDDLFVFNDADTSAWDHVDDFIAGAGSGDRLDLSDVAAINSMLDVAIYAADDVSGNTNIDIGNGNNIHLSGVSAGSLLAEDFIF